MLRCVVDGAFSAACVPGGGAENVSKRSQNIFRSVREDYLRERSPVAEGQFFSYVSASFFSSIYPFLCTFPCYHFPSLIRILIVSLDSPGDTASQVR